MLLFLLWLDDCYESFHELFDGSSGFSFVFLLFTTASALATGVGETLRREELKC